MEKDLGNLRCGGLPAEKNFTISQYSSDVTVVQSSSGSPEEDFIRNFLKGATSWPIPYKTLMKHCKACAVLDTHALLSQLANLLSNSQLLKKEENSDSNLLSNSQVLKKEENSDSNLSNSQVLTPKKEENSDSNLANSQLLAPKKENSDSNLENIAKGVFSDQVTAVLTLIDICAQDDIFTPFDVQKLMLPVLKCLQNCNEEANALVRKRARRMVIENEKMFALMEEKRL